MAYKRILTIQDISCVGQCSLTVALPILSACGVETCVLPSAALSTHTGGFKGYTFRDLSDDMPAIRKHWESEGIFFDAIYTGYLGSAKQIAYCKDIIASRAAKGCITAVDPAMADNGRLYPGFDMAYVEAMRSLVFSADVVLPNITEACLLTGTEYRESYDEAYIDALLARMAELGAKTVVLTGVSYEQSTTGVVVSESGKKSYYRHRRIPVSCHGTGDVYASAFLGALLQGHDTSDAARIAADYTLRCIELTQGDEKHAYGVKFELALPELIKEVRG